MNKKIPSIIIVLLVAGAIGGFIYYKNAYFPRYRWQEYYSKDSDQPYGLSLFFSALSGGENETKVVFARSFGLPDTTAKSANLIIVTDSNYIDQDMAIQLLKFAQNGNRVFISSNNSPLHVLKYFIPKGDIIYDYGVHRDSTARVNFLRDKIPSPVSMTFHYQFYKHKSAYNWRSYNSAYFDSIFAPQGFEPVSYLNDTTVNCFSMNHGEGMIIINSNPILLCNYYLSTEAGLEYANNHLTLLNKGPCYWYDSSAFGVGNNSDAGRNPLKLFFSHPYLKLGWYLFLLNILLYLLFRSKREQRIIPLMPVNVNTSIEYVKAIGTLYFRSNKHFYLVNELYHIFLTEIRYRYNIRTDVPAARLLSEISQRSGVQNAQVKYLFRQFKLLRDRPDVEAEELKDLYIHLEDFNKKRK